MAKYYAEEKLMTMRELELGVVHSSWRECIEKGLSQIDPSYLENLAQSADWLPGPTHLFNAFSLPLSQVNYVLFGESPYPRRESANGYAFWDAAVAELWSESGLNKKVNRATSLRNIIKMLLIAEELLDANNTSQENIAALHKENLVQNNHEFFGNFLNHGFLLLNATPVLQSAGMPQKDARAWRPFMQVVLASLVEQRPQAKFILFGRIANMIDTLFPATEIDKLYAEHPYNISFITNPEVIEFFRPLHLLRARRGHSHSITHKYIEET